MHPEVVRRRVRRRHDWPVALALVLDAGILIADHDFLARGLLYPDGWTLGNKPG
jgi:hypothetical protein